MANDPAPVKDVFDRNHGYRVLCMKRAQQACV